MNIRSALAALLLIFAVPASAQSCWPASYGPIQLGGTGSPVISGKQHIYSWWSWRCPSGAVVWKIARDGISGPSAADLLREAASYPTLLAAASALWTKYDLPACSADGPCDEGWIAARETAIAAGQAVQQPGPVVAPNGAYPTRPAYPVTAGVIGAKEAGRANVGERCDCEALSIVRSGVVYCSAPPPNQSLVAVCK